MGALKILFIIIIIIIIITDPSTDSYVFIQVKIAQNTQNYKPSLEIVTGVIDGDLVDAVLIFLGDAKAPSVSESFFLRL